MLQFDNQRKIYHSTILDNPHIISGFGTKKSGDGMDEKSLLHFFSSHSISYDHLMIPKQTHSTNVRIQLSSPAEHIAYVPNTDGLITKLPRHLLIVETADCVPIIFHDTKNNIAGISHQGWRGTLECMQTRMVEGLTGIGSDINSVHVAIGPSIGACCYNITHERYMQFQEKFPQYTEEIFEHKDNEIYLNLIKLNYLLLRDKGIQEKHIDYFPFCTKCNADMFYSYRREKQKGKGEMFNYVMIK
ncbi:MAG: peptidoglycan editing factor PgeF [bacterium]|nr:peptidoglycan editing factor PgeF [bacterium]